MRHFSLLLLFTLSSLVIQGQKAVQAILFPGYLAPHNTMMPHMAAHTFGAEAALVVNGSGNKTIDEILGDFRWGVGLYYMHLGKLAINGHVFAINPFFEFPIHVRKKSSTFLKIGTGIGYFNKRFDPISNPLNRAMSTPFNSAMFFHFLNEHELKNNLSIVYGPGLTHYSNGNFSKPNLGINTPQFNLGLVYQIKPKTSDIQKTNRFELTAKNYTEIRAGITSKQAAIADPVRKNIYTSSVTYGHLMSPIRYLRAGIDFFHDPLIAYKPFYPETLNGNKLSETSEIGFRIGQEYHLGIASVIGDLGYYLYKPTLSRTRSVYINVSIFFHYKNFSFGPRLKTHMGIADFMDFGIAYRIFTPTKKKYAL
jgi:hypothetical protein